MRCFFIIIGPCSITISWFACLAVGLQLSQFHLGLDVGAIRKLRILILYVFHHDDL